MKAVNLFDSLRAMPSLNATGKLKKEIATAHIGRKAVWVTTSTLDLDTDGGNDPAIKYERTHQSDTSLHWPKGSPVDSNVTRFVVIPGGKWSENHGIEMGDVGFAFIEDCNEAFAIIVADYGPKTKIGEASIALFRAFGHERVVNGRIKDVGIDQRFDMILFPGSGDGVCHNHAWIEAKALACWAAIKA